jgi:hypothetical protein
MQLTIINSNSSGNAYVLHNKEEALLIECGVRIDRIMQAIGFNVKKLWAAWSRMNIKITARQYSM